MDIPDTHTNLNYGVIGNCQSAALISKHGSIDWCCLPTFGSGSFFAALLDEKKGGRTAIEPVGDDWEVTQDYVRRTNILRTIFSSPDAEFEIQDFMPRYHTDSGGYHCPAEIIRYVRVLRGAPQVRVVYQPRPNYGRHSAASVIEHDYVKSYSEAGSYESLYLYTELDKEAVIEGRPVDLVDRSYILLSYNEKLVDVNRDFVRLELERTKVYWMNWVANTAVVPGYEAAVERSALVLKLLTYQKSGAILAAITTSLPETIGEVRNWDYRYCWIRDASMTVSVLTNLGHYNSVRRFLRFILDVVPFKDEEIQIMYGIEGQKNLKERKIEWLDGYLGSKPVRVGNEAYIQKQNDIYGILLDVIHQNFVLFREKLDYREDLWTVTRTLARHVENNWDSPDKGIWEFRTEKRHFVFSKVLCWVAMDRAAKIAGLLGRHQQALVWSQLREQIRCDVMEQGIHPELQAFTQSYGSEHMDAANLLMERYGFIDAMHPVYVNTVRLTHERLCVDGLMYRYRNEDDFGLPSSSFTVCTFWMIHSLARIGQRETAIAMFNNVLSYTNHVGLLSEDIDFRTKRLLGNFPQGYSHLALIDVAMTLTNTDHLATHEETNVALPFVPDPNP
ncbi:MAG: GH15 family glucan-1,4-alpha-glucosidase [Rhodothermales bacterium]|jgi:GH15 family glucan-1,4-alpha-glucosidase